MNNKLVILAEDAAHYLELLTQAALPNLSIKIYSQIDHNNNDIQECDILFGQPDLISAALPQAKNVKWVQSMWAGITPLLANKLRKDYQLTGVKGIFGQIMSEYVLCHLLMHERKSFARMASQQQKIWDQTTPGTLMNKTIGIMGLGSIGAHIAKTAKFFGMKTKGYSRTQRRCENVEHCFLPEQIIDFVQGLDYLVCVLPDTQETTHLINKNVLDALPDSAILINAGRGNIIDQSALVNALNSGDIAGAVLDVFPVEPLVKTDLLWETPNTVITAHTAAMSFPELVAPIFIKNYQNFRKDAPLQYQISFDHGY